MRSGPQLIAFMVTFFALCGCSDRGAEAEMANDSYSLYQVPGCGNTGLARLSSNDSCFTYDFDRVLYLSWCVPANCCPDSNRFALSSKVRLDTIIVAVRDTAQRNCRCTCPYTICASFAELPLDRYVFLVQYDGSLYYREVVYRGH